MKPDTIKRKNEHLRICLEEEVEYTYLKTGFDANAQIENARYLAVSHKSGHTPEKVAAIGLGAMYKRKRSAVVGFTNGLTVLFSGLVPATLKATLIKRAISWLTR